MLRLRPQKTDRARGMLIGTPLFVVQAGAHNIGKILRDGDRSTLTKMKPDALGTAAIGAIAKASVLKILQKVNSSRYNE